MDSYSGFSAYPAPAPQPGFTNLNQSVPFPTDVMSPQSMSTNPFYTPPPIPRPYHSIKRPQQVYESKDKTITNDFLFSCDVSSYDNLSDYGLILTQTRLLPAHSPAVCLRVWKQIRAKILLMEKSTQLAGRYRRFVFYLHDNQ